jgi:hypothetical protein
MSNVRVLLVEARGSCWEKMGESVLFLGGNPISETTNQLKRRRLDQRMQKALLPVPTR